MVCAIEHHFDDREYGYYDEQHEQHNHQRLRRRDVPFSAFATGKWTFGPPQIERFNRTLAMEITAQTGANTSTGQAMDAVDALVKKLPAGYGIDWTGQSYQERIAGSQAIYLYAISLIVVFLSLPGCTRAGHSDRGNSGGAARRVRRGAGRASAGSPNDVYFQVGLVSDHRPVGEERDPDRRVRQGLQAQGKWTDRGALEAAQLRLRPILMTSLAFIFGVLPLAIATGAGVGAAGTRSAPA